MISTIMKKNIDKQYLNLFIDNIIQKKYNFFTGVPDSSLKELTKIINQLSLPNIIATHESQAMGIAVGAEIAGKKSCVYLQNSGLGNLINPISSLCHPFEIFPLLIIGHRHTLWQHKIMGEIDKNILNLIKYPNYVIIHGENNVE
jgi:phosphonopyruvate decarboxylase